MAEETKLLRYGVRSVTVADVSHKNRRDADRRGDPLLISFASSDEVYLDRSPAYVVVLETVGKDRRLMSAVHSSMHLVKFREHNLPLVFPEFRLRLKDCPELRSVLEELVVPGKRGDIDVKEGLHYLGASHSPKVLERVRQTYVDDLIGLEGKLPALHIGKLIFLNAAGLVVWNNLDPIG